MGGLMSLIKANDLQTTTGGIPTVKGQKLIPTAWVNFNGTGTVAIRDSENVSSITDNGAGEYTINFSTTMANANYTPITGTWYGSDTSNPLLAVSGIRRGHTPTTTTLRIQISNAVWDSGSSGTDINGIYVIVMGGQA